MFYVQFELAWKVLKEKLKEDGSMRAVTGPPREIIKEAYKYYDFIEEAVWLDMLKERNDTAHIYDAKAAAKLAKRVVEEYVPVFLEMERRLR